MSEKKRHEKYRALLIGFLILDMIAFSLLAFSYFLKDAEDEAIQYEDAELVSTETYGQKVIPSGEPIGIYLKTDGVMVVDCGLVETAQGDEVSPCAGSLQTGDYIVEIDDTEVTNKSELMEYLEETDGASVHVTFLRDGTTYETDVTPAENASHTYMLGLWVKDDISGIGTMTFLSDNRFLALGHSVSDNDTGLAIRSTSGGVYKTHITQINKSFVSLPGQLQGTILYKKDLIGIIEGNFSNGIAGYLDQEYVDKTYADAEAVCIADESEVETGEALIYSRLDGTLEKYEIEITAVHPETSNKNIEFRVTDEDLIALTGGVCQGMSGSPIIQNGKLVGAVTHVLVDDPTQGYAVFIENMPE